MVEPVLELANMRLLAVLKNHSELGFGLSCGVDECVGACGVDFDRFFRKDVQAMTGGSDALRGVQTGGASDDHQIHRTMLQERVEILIGSAAVFAAEAGDFLGVASVNRGDFNSGDGAGGAGVSLRDVAGTDESDVLGHELVLNQRKCTSQGRE